MRRLVERELGPVVLEKGGGPSRPVTPARAAVPEPAVRSPSEVPLIERLKETGWVKPASEVEGDYVREPFVD